MKWASWGTQTSFSRHEKLLEISKQITSKKNGRRVIGALFCVVSCIFLPSVKKLTFIPFLLKMGKIHQIVSFTDRMADFIAHQTFLFFFLFSNLYCANGIFSDYIFLSRRHVCLLASITCCLSPPFFPLLFFLTANESALSPSPPATPRCLRSRCGCCKLYPSQFCHLVLFLPFR